MIRLLSVRLLHAVMVALLVGALTFLSVILQRGANVSPDESLPGLFFRWMTLMIFDPDVSMISGESVADSVVQGLGHSITLAIGAMLISLIIGPALGIMAGLRPGALVDRTLLFLSTATRATAHFVLGIILLMIFAVALGVLPPGGHGTVAHSILPIATLALGLAAVSAPVARDATRAIVSSPHYASERRAGLSAFGALRQQGLRTILAPLVSGLGVQWVSLIEGVIVVEMLFSWPGIGRELVHAIVQRDVPMIQGTALAIGLMFVMLKLLGDLASHRFLPEPIMNPQIAVQSKPPAMHALSRIVGRSILAGLVVFAVLVPFIWEVGIADQDFAMILSGPVQAHPLGTDSLGRDMLARLSAAVRLALGFALVTVITAAVPGILLGILAACKGGVIDKCLGLLADMVLVLPRLLLILLIVAIMPGALLTVYGAIALVLWTEYFCMTRALCRTVLTSPAVAESRLKGLGLLYVLRRHVWPELSAMLMTLSTFGAALTIMLLATLGFLGLGVSAPAAEPGLMITELLRYYAAAPLSLALPMVALFLMTFSLMLIGRAPRR